MRCRHFICLGLLGFLPVFEIATTDDSRLEGALFSSQGAPFDSLFARTISGPTTPSLLPSSAHCPVVPEGGFFIPLSMQTSTALLILLLPARQSSSPPPTPACAERSCDTICNVVELTVQSWFGLPFCVRRHRKCAHQHKLESRHCNNLRRDTEAVNCIKIVRGVCASLYFFWYFPFLVCFRTGACRDLHRFLVRY